MTKIKNLKQYLGKKLLAAEHTGRVRSHQHTSYGSLSLVLIIAAIPLVFIQHRVAADESASGIYSVVPAPTPQTPPTITNLSNGKSFSTSDPVSIVGTCPPDTLVKIFKNEVMAGATLCHGNVFTLNIDLFVGGNSLIARAYNANDTPGPDSTPLTVNLLLPGGGSASSFDPTHPPASQFYLTSDVVYRGATAGQIISWPVTIAGGKAPYALSVNWGDGKSDLLSRASAGQFVISHAYSKAANYNGNYTVTFKATDQTGATSQLQLFALVPGSRQVAAVTNSNTAGKGSSQSLQLVWQLSAIVSLVLFGFWAGEKRQLHHSQQMVARMV